MIVDHITYNPTKADPYDSTIFVPEHRLNVNKAVELSKHITPYVAYDSDEEKKFAQGLEGAREVLIFAKLPRKLKIPTPVGYYAPDWAIVFEEGAVRHVFFVAETKGSLDKMELRGVELAKTECAKRLFNSISTNTTRYGVVDKFDKLYDIINGIDQDTDTDNDIYRRIHFAVMAIERGARKLGISSKEMHDRLSEQD